MTAGSLTKPEQIRIAGPGVVEIALERPDRLTVANLAVPFSPMFNSTLARKYETADDPWVRAQRCRRDNGAAR